MFFLHVGSKALFGSSTSSTWNACGLATVQRKKEGAKAELDAVNEYLEGLTKKCDYKVESYEERKGNKLARHTTFLMVQAVASLPGMLELIEFAFVTNRKPSERSCARQSIAMASRLSLTQRTSALTRFPMSTKRARLLAELSGLYFAH